MSRSDESNPNEKQRLDAVAGDSWYARGVSAISLRHQTRVFERHWRPGACLELGPAEGLMTAELAKRFDDLTCVDGADEFCTALTRRFPNVRVVNALFEEFEPHRVFDTIVLGHVLEHVQDPGALLGRVRTWLAPHGRVLACVPNARSVHRQMAVEMGILPTEHSLNATDIHHGHRRVYDPETLRDDFRMAGLRVEVFGGFWLKPISNSQIDASWTEPMIEAAMSVGERYPDVAAEIYVVATSDGDVRRSSTSEDAAGRR